MCCLNWISHTHTRTRSVTHTHTHMLRHSLKHTHTHTHAQSLTQTHTHTHMLCHTHTHMLRHSLKHTHSVSTDLAPNFLVLPRNFINNIAYSSRATYLIFLNKELVTSLFLKDLKPQLHCYGGNSYIHSISLSLSLSLSYISEHWMNYTFLRVYWSGDR